MPNEDKIALTREYALRKLEYLAGDLHPVGRLHTVAAVREEIEKLYAYAVKWRTRAREESALWDILRLKVNPPAPSADEE